jgi:hypothetical protein
MQMGVRSFTAAVLVVASLLPAAAGARRVGPRMYALRMDGYIGEPPAKRREMADLRLRVSGENVRFQVTSARVTSGSMKAANVFNQVRPYRPNFILRGPKELLATVRDAPPGTTLQISGQWRPGSQDLLVSSVERK